VRSGVLFIERRSVFAEGIPGVKDENGSESDSAFIAQAKEDP
jgi:hypothetical protein